MFYSTYKINVPVKWMVKNHELLTVLAGKFIEQTYKNKK